MAKIGIYLGSKMLEVGLIVHSDLKQVVQAGLSVLFARVRHLSIYGVVDCQYWTSIDVDCVSGEDYVVDWRDVSG